MTLLLVVVALSVLAGALTRRWETLAVPALLVPLYYLGLNAGWWGHGVGDGWQIPAVALTVGATLATAASIAGSRAVRG